MKYMIAHNSDTVHYSQLSAGQSFDSGLTNIETYTDSDQWIERLQELGVDTEDIEVQRVNREEMETTRWRLMIVLDEMGLLDKVNEAVAQTDRQFQIAWKNADTITRLGKGISMIQDELGLSDEQIDEMFNQAKQIEI